MKNYRALSKTLFALFVSLTIILFLLSKIEYKNITSLLKNVNYPLIFFSWGIYLIGNGFKALRFVFLSENKKPHFTIIYFVTSLYNFFTSVFPSGIGEISYPLLLAKFDRQSIGVGTGSLILTRLYDFCFFLVMFLISGVEIIEIGYTIEYITIVFVLVISLSVLFNLHRFINFLGPRIIVLTKHINQKIYLKTSQLFTDASSFFHEKDNYKTHLHLIYHTLCIWLSSLFFFYFAFRAFSAPIPLFYVMFIASAINLTVVVPISTIGGFGVKEATLAAILVLTGLFESKTAISLSIVVRLVSFSSIFILLAIAYIMYKILQTRRP